MEWAVACNPRGSTFPARERLPSQWVPFFGADVDRSGWAKREAHKSYRQLEAAGYSVWGGAGVVTIAPRLDNRPEKLLFEVFVHALLPVDRQVAVVHFEDHRGQRRAVNPANGMAALDPRKPTACFVPLGGL